MYFVAADIHRSIYAPLIEEVLGLTVASVVISCGDQEGVIFHVLCGDQKVKEGVIFHVIRR